jgi:valyl-tRNA synthetase
LATEAIKAVTSKKITIHPKHSEKIYLHWLRNIRDWNISRQIVWGIRIPAWYCLGCGKPKINAEIKEKWFLVRHGETDHNKEKIYAGSTDIPLNETGLAQAMEAGEKLKSEKIDLIITSDLKRARQTAEIIAEKLGVKEIIFDDNLRERNGGVEWEGKNLERALYTDPDYIPQGGESWQEVEARVRATFEKHRVNHRGKNVLIVSHGGTMRVIRSIIRKLTIDKGLLLPRFINTEIIPLEISEPCKECGSDTYEQDPDVFDTWFSSGQWPFATLLTQDKKEDYKTFYPTDVMETGYDILFFWVARMVMLGLYRTKKIPFKDVYLHGLVRDKDRQKMSKSKGNVIDPLGVAEIYGTDAVRMALVVGSTPGTDIVISEDKIRGYRNFATKIWNASRFVLMNSPKSSTTNTAKIAFTKSFGGPKVTSAKSFGELKDKKNIVEVRKIKKEVAKHIEKFEFHLAAEKAYHYFWHTFADKIIEEAKPKLSGEDEEVALETYRMLEAILQECLIMLHPFMPYVTEEIYQKINPDQILMIQPWDN